MYGRPGQVPGRERGPTHTGAEDAAKLVEDRLAAAIRAFLFVLLLALGDLAGLTAIGAVLLFLWAGWQFLVGSARNHTTALGCIQ
jgi:hypothetical protein